MKTRRRNLKKNVKKGGFSFPSFFPQKQVVKPGNIKVNYINPASSEEVTSPTKQTCNGCTIKGVTATRVQATNPNAAVGVKQNKVTPDGRQLSVGTAYTGPSPYKHIEERRKREAEEERRKLEAELKAKAEEEERRKLEAEEEERRKLEAELKAKVEEEKRKKLKQLSRSPNGSRTLLPQPQSGGKKTRRHRKQHKQHKQHK